MLSKFLGEAPGGPGRFRSAGLEHVNSAGRYINSKLVSAGRRSSASQARRITDPRNTRLSSVVITGPERGLAHPYLYAS